MVKKTKEQKTLEYLRDEFERLKFNFKKYQEKKKEDEKAYNFYEGSMNGMSFAIMEIEKILEERF